MKDDQKLNPVLERFYNRYNKYNSKVLKRLGWTIKQFDGLTPSEAHKLAQELKYSSDIDELLKELSETSGKSVKDLEVFLDNVAEENVEFAKAYYEVRGKKYIPYEENTQLKRYVDTIKKETNYTFKNLSKENNIGFTFKDENGKTIFKPFKRAYRDLIDEAVNNVSMGVEDYQSAMRNTLQQLANSGVKIHEESATYKSGYNRRIDSTVRQNVLTGVRKVNIGIQEIIGEELGADGVEISAHSPCALDHLDYQGRQFSKKEFEKIQSSLSRPIGDMGYNCGHFIFQIILGVNLPSYSRSQLNRLNRETLREIEYEGKIYNAYEMSQVMRGIETSIRKNKDQQIIGRASNDKDLVSKSQKNISILTSKYNEISKVSNLPTYKERLVVSGYRKVNPNNM